jgi:hypothetical protein
LAWSTLRRTLLLHSVDAGCRILCKYNFSVGAKCDQGRISCFNLKRGMQRKTELGTITSYTCSCADLHTLQKQLARSSRSHLPYSALSYRHPHRLRFHSKLAGIVCLSYRWVSQQPLVDPSLTSSRSPRSWYGMQGLNCSDLRRRKFSSLDSWCFGHELAIMDSVRYLPR